jgi:hypothetical protein
MEVPLALAIYTAITFNLRSWSGPWTQMRGSPDLWTSPYTALNNCPLENYFTAVPGIQPGTS